MFAGKVGQACKFINNDDSITGIHSITEAIKQVLLEKHPKAEEVLNEVLLPVTRPTPNPVIYEQLTAEVIERTSKDLSGSGGPTLVNTDAWKYFLCSRSYGRQSFNLAEAVSNLARRLCTERIHPDCLEEYIAGRLIPLDKGADKFGNPGVRPIGIGEVLRRIVAKSVTTILKTDIQTAGGCLQTCTGIRAGIEAAIHATSEAWHKHSTEGLLQVDADNAFNRLNRKVALHNIQEVCPPIQVFLHNHYQKAAKLSVSTSTEPEIMLSEEGCTQGDPAAMAFYALGVKPLVDELSICINKQLCQQSWYADDSNAIGKLVEIKVWWQKLVSVGPKFGYFPKPSKTVLIIKDHSLMEQAKALFSDTGIEITTLGQRHLGAVIGSETCKNTYVSSKVEKWVEDIVELSKIAVEEPQAALSAYM